MPHRQRAPHAPILYPHPEAADDEDDYAPGGGGTESTPRRPRPNTYASTSSVGSVASHASSSSLRSQRSRPRQTVSYGATTVMGGGGVGAAGGLGSAESGGSSSGSGKVGKDGMPLSKYQSAFASFATRYRRDPGAYDEYGDDGSGGGFSAAWNVGALDVESDDEDGRPSGLRASAGGVPVFDRFAADLGEGTPVIPRTDEERERLEWQAMLASVLEGDVLRMEKTRIASTSDESRDEAKRRTLDIWLGFRARLRGRTEEEERKRLEERRVRTVQPAIDEILSFTVSTAPGAPAPLDQALALLDKLDVAESLYPDLKSMRAEYPDSEKPEFLERTAALLAYVRMVSTLRARIQGIQKWTGSETMDVWQRHTSREEPVRRSGPAGHLLGPGQELQDESSFVERVLKEDSIQKTLERATLVTSHWVVDNARETMMTYGPLFREMQLPGVEKELVALIAFPTKLMEATLRVRLDYGKKVNEPSVLVVDQMLDDFSLSIALACTIKQEYEEFMRPDEMGWWDLPSCISDGYDEVLLEALRFLFKLIHWKLKTASRIYFKEVDVLEAQWPLFTHVSLVTEGGSLLVAEHVCSVTNKLMARVVNLFEAQLSLPVYKPSLDSRSRQSPRNVLHRPRLERANAAPIVNQRERPMDEAQILDWYNTVLDSVRLRYRKLQRFGRVLTQRFTNAAEYTIAQLPVDRFINALVRTDHLLVYCENYEQDGIYIIADTSLRNRPYMIHDILQRTFQPVDALPKQHNATDTSGAEEEEEEDTDSTPYILLITPGERFVWTGDVMVFETPKLDFELTEKRVRLVADGPQPRLARAKDRFGEIMRSIRPESVMSPTSTDGAEPSMNGNGVDGSFDGGNDYCIIPQQAHHPRVDRQMRRITRSTNRLAEAITKSVHKVSETLDGVEHRQELLANWYAFAAENGQQAQKHMDYTTWQKFNRELMKLAIAYVSFICDECDPTDRRTFRWAVNALEFATLRTRGSNILNLPESDFNLLRSKVATCMTLLISHFDILGARSNLEASQREQERLSQIKQRQEEAEAKREDDEMVTQPGTQYDPLTVSNWAKDRSIRLNRDESWLRQLQELDARRAQMEFEQRLAGKVINEERPEDKSLVFLASSSSNIALRWQQGRLIGTGAFGSVYLGVNLDSGSLMAVKEIRFSDVNSLTTLYKNVKDELSVMEMLSHPNIVEYYGIEVHRDKVYIFEEYCQGGSLASLLEHGRIEDESVIQVYTLQMLEGLQYLHSKGVVHRDIKPDNILLDHMGVIKYVDFGAAKILGKKQKTLASRKHQHPVGHHSHERPHGHVPPAPPPGFPSGFGANSLTGTPMYMSPEVIKNDRRGRQGAMDIWSLGCVVLEMSTGKKPWSNLDNEWAIMFHIGVAAKPPPLPDPSQLSELGIDFIRRCLTIDPMHRPTAAELMEHPWIAAFRAEMLEYEEEEATSMTTPSMTTTHTSVSEQFELATVAHQAQRIEEQDAAAMKSESPPDITPGESEDGILAHP